MNDLLLNPILLFLLSFSTGYYPEYSRNNGINAAMEIKTNELKILNWNIYMLPYCNLINRNNKRARAIAEKLLTMKYDIIVFQEAFDQIPRQIIRKKLQHMYPYIYGPANVSRFSFRTNSGLWVLSKVPLNKLEEIEYRNRTGIDAWARKGAVMFQGCWNEHDFQVVATHLQADSSNDIRRKQCLEVATRLLEKYAIENVPQFVCGDFNIEMADTENYDYMLHSLNAENGHIDGDIHVSFDEIDNCLARRDKGKKLLIDYILIRNNSRKIDSIKRRISVLKDKIDRKIDDLSDHYGIEALVHFKR
ncbi:MAG TPA: sphingomyelin phosphodiesterase [Bacteroidales bacterium]|nr:sphingomyelin phosphodiesterase [Bacteroidales bacterium]